MEHLYHGLMHAIPNFDFYARMRPTVAPMMPDVLPMYHVYEYSGNYGTTSLELFARAVGFSGAPWLHARRVGPRVALATGVFFWAMPDIL